MLILIAHWLAAHAAMWHHFRPPCYPYGPARCKI